MEPAQSGPNHGDAERDGDDGDMELDEDDQRNVDDLVYTMVGPETATSSDAGRRAELKRRITAVAKGIVRKKLEKNQQCWYRWRGTGSGGLQAAGCFSTFCDGWLS